MGKGERIHSLFLFLYRITILFLLSLKLHLHHPRYSPIRRLTRHLIHCFVVLQRIVLICLQSLVTIFPGFNLLLVGLSILCFLVQFFCFSIFLLSRMKPILLAMVRWRVTYLIIMIYFFILLVL